MVLTMNRSPSWRAWAEGGRERPGLDGHRRGAAGFGRDAAGRVVATAHGDADDGVAGNDVPRNDGAGNGASRRPGVHGRRPRRTLGQQPHAVPSFGGQQLRDPGCDDVLAEGQLEAQRLQAGVESGQVPLQLDRDASPGPESLEHAIAQLEATVVGGEMRAAGGQEPAVEPDVGRCRRSHATSPKASSEGGALSRGGSRAPHDRATVGAGRPSQPDSGSWIGWSVGPVVPSIANDSCDPRMSITVHLQDRRGSACRHRGIESGGAEEGSAAAWGPLCDRAGASRRPRMCDG